MLIVRMLFMRVLLVLALISLVLPVMPCRAQNGAVVTGLEVSNTAPDIKAVTRQILSGVPLQNGRAPDTPFMFRTLSGLAAVAQDRGLEGFYFSKRYLDDKFGPQLFVHQSQDYFGYIDYVLMRRADLTYDGRQLVSAVKARKDAVRRSRELNLALGAYIARLQRQYSALAPSQWALKSRIYQIFPRAYNLRGRRGEKSSEKTVFFRDFEEKDFAVIKAMGFDAVWPMGIYPVGLRGRTGSAGGSVYAIRDHEGINPELGTEADFRAFVAKAHSAGLKVLIDLVGNHTSQDSVLLDEDPSYYINMPAGGPKPEQAPANYFSHKTPDGWVWVRKAGYFCNRAELCSWDDVAQLDYSNPKLWEKQIQIARGLVQRFDVDGFRVDMAYQLLSAVYSRNWGLKLPPGEFLERLIGAVRELKPEAAFIAEAYDNQDELSSVGFDLFYNKSEWGRLEGHAGWYDAMASGSHIDVAAALERAAFLSWRRGGAGGLNFFGNHDEPAAEKVFGARLPAVAAATMFMPGAFLLYNGAEIGFDASVRGEEKTIPFSVPVSIDWAGGRQDSRRLYEKLFAEAAALRAELGDYYIRPLPQPELSGWAGYLLQSKDSPRLKKALIFNYTAGPVRVDLGPLKLEGFSFAGTLEVGGYRLLAPVVKNNSGGR